MANSSDGNGASGIAFTGLVGCIVLVLRMCSHMGGDIARVVAHEADDAARLALHHVDDIAARGERVAGQHAHDLAMPAIEGVDNAAERAGDDLARATPDNLAERVARQAARDAIREGRRLASDPTLTRVAQQPRLMPILPRNDVEFLTMFNHQMSQKTERELSTLLGTMADDRAVVLPENPIVGMPDLKAEIGSLSDSNTIVILGHSDENGKLLVLPSGARVEVADIHKMCQSEQKSCLVLTCYGRDFDTRGEIAFEVAYQMFRRTAGSTADGGESVGQFVARMNRERRALVTEKVALNATITTAGMVTAYATMSEAARFFDEKGTAPSDRAQR